MSNSIKKYIKENEITQKELELMGSTDVETITGLIKNKTPQQINSMRVIALTQQATNQYKDVLKLYKLGSKLFPFVCITSIVIGVFLHVFYKKDLQFSPSTIFNFQQVFMEWLKLSQTNIGYIKQELVTGVPALPQMMPYPWNCALVYNVLAS